MPSPSTIRLRNHRDSYARACHQRLRRIRRQLASKSGHGHNQCRRAIRRHFSHNDRQRHGAVTGRNGHDRIIFIRDLDWRPSPLLVFLATSDTSSRHPLLGGFTTEDRRKPCGGGIMQILAISGSLRAASANTNLLKAAAAMAPEEVTLSLYDGLGDLPPFNPDVDKDPLHAAVAEFRSQLRQSAGVDFSTPEYAHCVPR